MSRLPKPEIADLISYVIGETTPEEATRVQQWLVESHDHQQLFHNVQRFVQAVRTRRALSHTDSADVISRAFAAHVAQGKRRHATTAAPSIPRGDSAEQDLMRRGAELVKRAGRLAEGSLGRRTLRRALWSLSTMLVSIAAFSVFRFGSSRPSGITRRYTTGINQQGSILLGDGTRVTLAPLTTLRLLNFSQQHRIVAVDGKAYFEVVRAEGAPFEVLSGVVTARVLGTSFLVDHALHSARVRVAVEEGKVHVSSASRANVAFTVSAGYVGEFTDSLMRVTAVEDSAPGTEWLRGKLVFRHTPVATVLQTLSRWYGYQFRYADSTLSQRNVTIGLSIRSPAFALETLEQILSVNLTVIGDTVTLTPRGDQRVKGMPRVHSYDVWTPSREVGR